MSASGNTWGGPSGFSVLIWEDDPNFLECKENLQPATDEEDLNPTTTLMSGDQHGPLPSPLEDAKCLLSGRWSIAVEEHYFQNQWYLWAVCTRFSVGEETIKRALGDLMNLLSFQRGSPNQDFNTAVRYKICRERWGVPQVIVDRSERERSGDTCGTGGHANKRLRF